MRFIRGDLPLSPSFKHVEADAVERWPWEPVPPREQWAGSIPAMKAAQDAGELPPDQSTG